MEPLSIGQFAQVTGLSAHTLRYYEKEGLLSARRGVSRQRHYREDDLRWVEFIKRLKETGMPIKEIKHYADLRAEGEATLVARMDMLIAHRAHILSELSTWQTHLKKMEQKISYYERELMLKADAPKKK